MWADEWGTDALDELGLTLSLLEWIADPSPDILWRSLAPFLCDTTGNSHRAEMNIEKLWNPYLEVNSTELGGTNFQAIGDKGGYSVNCSKCWPAYTAEQMLDLINARALAIATPHAG